MGLKDLYEDVKFKAIAKKEAVVEWYQSDKVQNRISKVKAKLKQAKEKAKKYAAEIEKSEQFQKMFPNNTYVAFATDLSDFNRKLTELIVNTKFRGQITKNAKEFVTPGHSWEVRVKTLLEIVAKRLVKQ